ncbi:MAG: hypothetical protein CM15mP83_7580 [Flavobacteriaceae bacterium]|nr:MAG: hypothetical protein CM15mP83_7580 [Flavobacteriaceae bacterium]
MIALVALCITLYIVYSRAKKRIEEWRKKLPPFDRAIQELQALEASQLNDQEEYKNTTPLSQVLFEIILKKKQMSMPLKAQPLS